MPAKSKKINKTGNYYGYLMGLYMDLLFYLGNIAFMV